MTANIWRLLLLGALIVVIDGQILYQNGKRYLGGYCGDESAAPMTRLIVVLFHLVALGILAIISTIDIGGTGLQAVVTRLGVALILVAIFHAGALIILSRVREARQEEARWQSAHAERNRDRHQLYDPVVAPVGGQNGPQAQVSPELGSTAPYET